MTGPAVGQVKRFFRFYSINRHKMTTLTPSCGPAPCRAHPLARRGNGGVLNLPPPLLQGRELAGILLE